MTRPAGCRTSVAMYAGFTTTKAAARAKGKRVSTSAVARPLAVSARIRRRSALRSRMLSARLSSSSLAEAPVFARVCMAAAKS